MDKEIEWLLKEKYHSEKSEAFFADVARLETGEPLGYIIGHVPFLNTTIYLDSKPLIPRPETEYWVAQAIQNIHNRLPAKQLHILDLCAGSGAIGVAIANAIPTAQVTFGEIDGAHLPTITKNLAENTVKYHSVSESDAAASGHTPTLGHSIIISDLFQNITGKFEYIFCNPPYIDAAAGTAEKSVTDFEPHLALFGGVAGMELLTTIIKEARTHLTLTGQLWLEHEPSQVTTIQTLATQTGFTCVTHPDQYNIPRYSILTMAQ